MSTKITFNAASGEYEEVEMAGAELAAYEATLAAGEAASTGETQFRAALAAARPPGALLVKLRDGTALTAGELAAVVRWLALRELRELFS